MEPIKHNQYLRGEGDGGRTTPIFFIEAVQDHVKSKEEGRPIFREVEKVKLHFAGNPHSVPVMEVTDDIKAQFPQHYAAFKRTGEMAIVGTPLKEWASLSVSRIAELNAQNIWTVENLASLDDAGLQRIGMGGRELVAKAKAYIESAQGNSPIEALASENIRLSEQVELQGRQIAELKGALDALMPPEKKRKAS